MRSVSAALGSDASHAGVRVSAALQPTPGCAGLRLCMLRAMQRNRSLPSRPCHPNRWAGVSDTLTLTPSVTEVEGHRLREPRELTGSGNNGPSLGLKLGSVCPSIQTLTFTFEIPKNGNPNLGNSYSVERQELRAKVGVAGLSLFPGTLECASWL